jgi:hypothetical protein
MKKTLIIIGLLAFASTLWAQIPVANKKQINDFYKTTTLVVREDGIFSDFNVEIEQAMKKYWTATPYKFISMSEVEQYMRKPEYSLLMKTRIRYDAKDVTDVEYSFLTLVMGFGSAENITQLPDLCSFPLSYDKGDPNKYTFKLPTAVQFMQNHVALTRTDESLNTDNIIKYYNKNKTAFNDKTLYVLKEDLSSDVNSIAKIKKIYHGKVEIVTEEAIKKAINEANKDIVYLHKVGPTMKSAKARCWKLVLSAADATLYYFDYHKITAKAPDGILESDFKSFKKMNR